MPVVVAESSTMAEHLRYRKPRNQILLQTDPSLPKIPSIIQSTRCTSTISSLLLSSFSPTITSDNPTAAAAATKKKNFTSATFRGLGCAASSQVSVPAVIRSSANWETKKMRKKKQKKNKALVQAPAMANANPSSTSSSLVVPDVWCGPGIGFTADAAASIDCVVSRRPASGRGKVDGEKMNQRELRTAGATRRMVNSENISFFDADPELAFSHHRLDVFGNRHQSHVRHRSPEGLAEIVMFQSSLLMGGRSVGLDQYRDLRLDIDSMSYEELLDLGDRIGYVSTGLREDEITRCLCKTKISTLDNMLPDFPKEMQWKCSVCQEEYEADDEMGKLDCGHFYHIECIKHWLRQKNACPICKTAVTSQK